MLKSVSSKMLLTLEGLASAMKAGPPTPVAGSEAWRTAPNFTLGASGGGIWASPLGRLWLAAQLWVSILGRLGFPTCFRRHKSP